MYQLQCLRIGLRQSLCKLKIIIVTYNRRTNQKWDFLRPHYQLTKSIFIWIDFLWMWSTIFKWKLFHLLNAKICFDFSSHSAKILFIFKCYFSMLFLSWVIVKENINRQKFRIKVNTAEKWMNEWTERQQIKKNQYYDNYERFLLLLRFIFGRIFFDVYRFVFFLFEYTRNELILLRFVF